jgi:membrane protease YdiL (CAAX protease family)
MYNICPNCDFLNHSSAKYCGKCGYALPKDGKDSEIIDPLSDNRERKTSWEDYFNLSRTPLYSVIFVLPLLFIYEIGAMIVNRSEFAGIRNASDVLIKRILALFGIYGFLYFTLALVIASAIFIWYEITRRRYVIKLKYFMLMLAESLLYASLFGIVVGMITSIFVAKPIRLGLGTSLVLSLGAGIYEELVYRLLLVSALAFAFTKIPQLTRTRSRILAIVLGAFLFSLSHYLGAFSDIFTLKSFLFRFNAGLVFSLLFIYRGFGIAAYTHSLYDLLLVLELWYRIGFR